MRGSVLPNNVSEFRSYYYRERIGRFYNGWVHFLFTSFSCLAVITWSITKINSPTKFELMTVPIAFLFANFVEYMAHRFPMHRPMGVLKILCRRHAGEHHLFYTDEAMAWSSSKDLKMVLFPPIMILFFIGGIAFPISQLCFYLGTANVGYLFIATALGYFLNYEWLHTIYHLSANNILYKIPGMEKLRALHKDHHQLELMNKYNFNITYPIMDLIFGTYYFKK